MDQAMQTKNNIPSNTICHICKRGIESLDDVETCSICGIKMHRKCIDEEILIDSEGSILCPYDAALAALDWLDAILSIYISSLTKEQREEIIERLKIYLNVLSQDIKE